MPQQKLCVIIKVNQIFNKNIHLQEEHNMAVVKMKEQKEGSV